MLKFKGKPHELIDFFRNIKEYYGENHTMIEIYIMMSMEYEDYETL